MGGDSNSQPAVPIAEAARILGVSRRTVERRLASGELHGHKADGRWLVVLPAPATPEADTLRAEAARLSEQVADLSEKHDSLTRQLADLARERDDLAERCARLSQDLASVTRERDNLTRQVADLERDRAELGRRVEDLEGQRRYLQDALAAALTVKALLAERTSTRPWWQVWRR